MRSSSQAVAIALLATLVAPISTFAKSSEGLLHENKTIKTERQTFKQEKDGKERKEAHKQEVEHRSEKSHTTQGTLTAVNGSALTLKKTDGTSVVVQAGSAKLVRRFGAKMTLAELQTQDQLEVVGKVATGTAEITASVIRDLSLQARNGTFSGSVASIDTSAKTFVLQTDKRDTQTIMVDADTKITKNDVPATFADLAVSGTVRVVGVWNRTNENVKATSLALTTPLARIRVEGKVTVDGDSEVTIVTDDQKTYVVDLRKSNIFFSQEGSMKKKEIRLGDRLNVSAKAEVGSTRLNAVSVRNLSWQNRKTQVVHFTDQSGTIQTTVGNRLLLNLGKGYVWSTASTTNATVLAPTATKKNRFDARTVGQADITVTGEPVCRLSTPACAAPSVSFKVTVNVVAKS